MSSARNEDELRAIYDRYRAPMMSYCLVATRGDRDQAKDLVQEIFVRAFRSLDRLEDPEKMRGWMFTIAANVVRTSVSKDARRREVLTLYGLDQDSASSEDQEMREAVIAQVRAVIAGVDDPMLKKIVELKYGEPEHTTRAIADVLSIPHGTVTVKLMRFRARIKAKLALVLAEEGLTP